MQRLLAPLAHVPLLRTLLLRWSSSCPPLHGDGTFERSARVLHVCPHGGRWEVRAYAPIEVEDEVLGDLVDVVLAVDIQFPRRIASSMTASDTRYCSLIAAASVACSPAWLASATSTQR